MGRPSLQAQTHPTVAPMEPHLELLLWLGVALFAQILVSLFGVFGRDLQTLPDEPIPPLRLLLVVSLLALAALLALESAAHLWRWLRRLRHASRQQQQKQAQGKGATALHQVVICSGPSPPAAAAAAAAAEKAASAAGGSPGLAEQSDKPSSLQPAASQQASLVHRPEAGQLKSNCHGQLSLEEQRQQGQPQQQQQGKAVGCAPDHDQGGEDQATLPRQQQQEEEQQLARPGLPLQRGLSRRLQGMQSRHPRLYRWAAAALIGGSMAGAGGCQLMAPGFVDAAIVQLVYSFSVILVALIQAVLLRLRLPLLIWPCAAAMVGGSAMVIAPTVGQGAGASGGLNSGRAWLGFGLALVAMLSAAVMYVALQAFRGLRISGQEVQYWYLGLSIAISLPLTLALDGTANWAQQFAGWDPGNWAMLVLTGTVVCVGGNFLITHTTWKLGAPIVSLMLGARLVASVVGSKIVLAYTVVHTGVQIAGVVVVVTSITVYMGWQWLLSRRSTTAAAAAAAEPADAAEAELAGARMARDATRAASKC